MRWGYQIYLNLIHLNASIGCLKEIADMKSIGPSRILEASKYVQEVGNINDIDSEEEWLDANDSDGDTTRNFFEIFDDQEDI